MYGQGNDGGGFRPRSFAPVSVGEELDVNIEAVGEKGDGIAKKKGFVLFVPGVSKGDNVRIKITKVLRKVGFAEVIGKALGPIETDQKESSAEEAPQEETAEKTEESQDSEDFGEESESSEESSEGTDF